MGTILKIKEMWDDGVPKFRNKVTKMLNSSEENRSSDILNPFLDRNGNLVNPYLNYQQVLDNPNVTSKAKTFIANATGLTPTQVINPISGVSMAGGENTLSPASVGSNGKIKASDSSIVNAARNYLGTPYVWGGESMAEGGMDCSGFVYNALKDAGYDVGRTTAQGYRSYGNSVSKSEMQPGDLVFFGKNGNASHIGIYIGNGQMIHSSGGSKNTKSNPGKGVSVTNVDYRSDFLEARRY